MARMAQEQSSNDKEPGEIVKTEEKPKETKLAKVQPQVCQVFLMLLSKKNPSCVSGGCEKFCVLNKATISFEHGIQCW